MRLRFRHHRACGTLARMAFQRRTTKVWDESALYEYAILALGRRMRSVAELKRLMRQRLGSQQGGELLMDTVVARLKEQGYLDDHGYARTYAILRRDNDKLGRRRVVSDLKSRGIRSEVIEKAVSSAYLDVNEEQMARAYIRRKRLSRPASDKEAARIFRALARAGFAPRTIVAVLKSWKIDDELLDALESQMET